jgi:uroporphyrinogen-III synthase
MTKPWLCTKVLTDNQRAEAARLGLSLVEFELFETVWAHPIPWPKEVGTALFTSIRGVQALGDGVKRLATTPVFCVGQQAGQALRQAGITPTVQGLRNAEQLGAFVGQFPLRQPVVHFCGQQRHPTLRAALAASGVPLTEVVVYRRAPLPLPELPTEYAGILFFSPRGVARFLEAIPSTGAGVQVAALGTTTAKALAMRGFGPIHVPHQQPSVNALLDVIAHLQSSSL